jgi:hypothetical protein
MREREAACAEGEKSAMRISQLQGNNELLVSQVKGDAERMVRQAQVDAQLVVSQLKADAERLEGRVEDEEAQSMFVKSENQALR